SRRRHTRSKRDWVQTCALPIFTVTGELAEEEDLEKVSDIEDIAPDLEFGVDNAWLNREGDGYEAFTEQYGFEFAKAYPMQIGLRSEERRVGKDCGSWWWQSR